MGTGVVLAEICSELQLKHDELVDKRVLSRAFHALGFTYGNIHKDVLKNNDYLNRRTLTFIKNYADFLRDPDCVMVWLDDSYINENYARTKTWSGPKGSDAYFTTQPENIGRTSSMSRATV